MASLIRSVHEAIFDAFPTIFNTIIPDAIPTTPDAIAM
jgi:hypothetical protein